MQTCFPVAAAQAVNASAFIVLCHPACPGPRTAAAKQAGAAKWQKASSARVRVAPARALRCAVAPRLPAQGPRLGALRRPGGRQHIRAAAGGARRAAPWRAAGGPIPCGSQAQRRPQPPRRWQAPQPPLAARWRTAAAEPAASVAALAACAGSPASPDGTAAASSVRRRAAPCARAGPCRRAAASRCRQHASREQHGGRLQRPARHGLVMLRAQRSGLCRRRCATCPRKAHPGQVGWATEVAVRCRG